MEYLLLIYLNLVKPAYSYILILKDEQKLVVPESHIIVTGYQDTFDLPTGEVTNENILSLFEKYNIVDIVEVHDWDRILNFTDIANYQEIIDKHQVCLPDIFYPVKIITILNDSDCTEKYVVPLNFCSSDLDDFAPYKVLASYNSLFKKYCVRDFKIFIYK